MFNPRWDKPLEGSRSVHHSDKKFLKNLSNSESDKLFLTNPTLSRFRFVLLEGARTCPHRSYDEELLARRFHYLHSFACTFFSSRGDLAVPAEEQTSTATVSPRGTTECPHSRYFEDHLARRRPCLFCPACTSPSSKADFIGSACISTTGPSLPAGGSTPETSPRGTTGVSPAAGIPCAISRVIGLVV